MYILPLCFDAKCVCVSTCLQRERERPSEKKGKFARVTTYRDTKTIRRPNLCTCNAALRAPLPPPMTDILILTSTVVSRSRRHGQRRLTFRSPHQVSRVAYAGPRGIVVVAVQEPFLVGIPKVYLGIGCSTESTAVWTFKFSRQLSDNTAQKTVSTVISYEKLHVHR